VNIGIIGAGGIAALHAQAYRKLPTPIVAVTDIDRSAFESKSCLFGSAKFVSTPQELVSDPSVDAVDICVNTRFHAEMIELAVAAGKHIFCEKTLTDSEPNSAKVLRLLSGYTKNFQVGYMKRFFPATAKFAELMEEIGTPISAYVRSYQGYERDFDPFDDAAWKPRGQQQSKVRTSACGGMLNMAGSHMLDLLGLFLGEPASVYSLSWMPDSYDAETNSHALFRMENGCCVHFEAALSPFSRDGLWRDGWDERFEVTGTRGKIEIVYPVWNEPGYNAPMLRLYRESDRLETCFAFPKVDPFEREMLHFIKNSEAGAKSIPGAPEGYFVDRMISACYASASSGASVNFESGSTT
jgi:predicted dehydrogenase